MRIKAAVARHGGVPLDIASLDLDEPRDGEILVRLIAAGVGRSDRAARAGKTAMPLPFVPGSEGAGIVERVGHGVVTPAPGDAVLIGYSACGECAKCIEGDQRRCATFDALNLAGTRADGTLPFVEDGNGLHGFFFGQSAFATHLICRAIDAVILDSDAPLELFAAVGGEFLTGAAPLLHVGRQSDDDAVVITGAGTIGLAACMMAKAQGFTTIIVAEPDEGRRALALDVGATIVVPSDTGLAAMVRTTTTSGPRLAIEASGTRSGRDACLASLTAGSTCVFARSFLSERDLAHHSLSAHDARIESAQTGIVMSEIVPMLVGLHRDGKLPIEKLVNFFPFEHVNDALDAAESGAVVKPVLRFSLGSFGDLDRAVTEGAAIDEASDDVTSEPEGEDAEQAVGTPVTA